jgi:hypothetical protein
MRKGKSQTPEHRASTDPENFSIVLLPFGSFAAPDWRERVPEAAQLPSGVRPNAREGTEHGLKQYQDFFVDREQISEVTTTSAIG